MPLAGVLSGDMNSLSVFLYADDPLEAAPVLLSGSFRPSPEERRVGSIFVELDHPAGVKTLEFRIEYTDPRFVQLTIAGRSIPVNVESPGGN